MKLISRFLTLLLLLASGSVYAQQLPGGGGSGGGGGAGNVVSSGSSTANDFPIFCNTLATCVQDSGISSIGTMAGQSTSNVNITGGSITGLSNPSQASDAANKGYVDAVAQGLSVRASVRLATAAVLPNS